MSPGPRLRARLEAGEPVIGTFVKSSDPSVAELLAGLGYDCLVADVEHSSLGHGDVEAIARAAAVHGVPALARIAPHEVEQAGRLLDSGLVGLQVTDVTSEETLAALEAASRFPPHGRRSLALSHRGAGFGTVPMREFLDRSDSELLRIVQIESRAGVAALERLLASAHRPDVWFVGPLDLSIDLGHPGEQGHPEVAGAIDEILAAVHASGARSGIFARDAEDARAWLARGVSFILLGSDVTLLAGAARAALAAARA